MTDNPPRDIDIVMLGTFSAWKLGTIQARALPFARELSRRGLSTAIVTTPWDRPEDAGTIDVVDGVPVINTAEVRPARAAVAVGEQIGWARRLRPRAVHLVKPKGFGGLAARALMMGRRTLPVVVDYDDWEGDGGWNDIAGYSRPQRILFNWQERDLIVNAGHVVAANTLLFKRAEQLRGSDHNVSFIPNGLQVGWREQLAAGRTSPPGATEPPTVLLYSRFAEFPSNWVPEFTTALARHSTGPVRFVVVGDLPPELQRFDVPVPVIFEPLGYVERERLPEILGSADITVFPYEDSLITRTKQSVKLLELMAAGCPVIGSAIGDVARTLGPAGVVLPTAAPSTFAEEIVELLSCREKLARLSQAGQERVRSRYSIELLADDLAGVYRKLGLH